MSRSWRTRALIGVGVLVALVLIAVFLIPVPDDDDSDATAGTIPTPTATGLTATAPAPTATPPAPTATAPRPSRTGTTAPAPTAPAPATVQVRPNILVQPGAIGVTDVHLVRGAARVAVISYTLDRPAIATVDVLTRGGSVPIGRSPGRRRPAGQSVTTVDLRSDAPGGLRVVLATVPIGATGPPTVVTLASGPPLGSIALVSPTEGSTIVGSDVVVRVRPRGFRLTGQGTTPEAGQGHYHLFLDGRAYIVVYRPTFVLRGVDPGRHTLVMQPVENNHADDPTSPSVTVRFRTVPR